MAAIDDLIKQIQSRSNTSQWTGGYGADAATKGMARILSSIGITNIKDFGKIDTVFNRPAHLVDGRGSVEQGLVVWPRLPNTLYHLNRETHPLFRRTAVLIRAQIGSGR